MITKHCPRCEEILPVSAFYPHHRDGYTSLCKDCQNERNRQRYAEVGRADRRGSSYRRRAVLGGLGGLGPVNVRKERMRHIRQRVARRHAEGRKVGLHAELARCLLPRIPETIAELRTIHQQPPCGALCFVGEERDHCTEVHGMTGAVQPGWFVLVEERRDEEDRTCAPRRGIGR